MILRLAGKTNKEFQISTIDLPKVKLFSWYFVGDSNKGHVFTKINGKTTYLHRFLLNPKTDEEVDHINRDGMDNRRSNLRIVSHKQNMINLSSYKNNTSGAMGVVWSKHAKKWHAQINIDKKPTHLGYFDDIGDAKKARLEAEQKRIKQIVR